MHFPFEEPPPPGVGESAAPEESGPARPATTAGPQPARRDPYAAFAVGGFVLGVVGVIAWVAPLVGLPVTGAALLLSFLGRQSFKRRGLAQWGLRLAAVFLVVTVLNAALGAALYLHRR